jgi:hypothetical protein
VFNPAQHGFLARHSTCTNLLESMADWTTNLDNKTGTIVTYIDYQKAVDSVSILKLIHKLKHFGITGNLINCLASFLTNRSQKVKVENQFSNTRFLRSGVPQGSVLGPILFIVYINDVTDMLPNCAISKIFADDLKSYIPITSEADLLNYKRLLYGLSMWSTMWQLPMAPKKCQWMFIANKSYSIQSENDFKIQGTVLEEVNFQTDLGIIFTSSLCFKEHINIICNKARWVIVLIYKRFITKDRRLLLLAYKSYVQIILTYCSPVWSP